MALARGRRRYVAIDYWPGFVDALSTLLLVVVFLLSVFSLAQYFVSRDVSKKDETLARLNNQLAELTQLLALERTTRLGDDDALGTLNATLSASRADSARLQSLIDQKNAAAGGIGDAQKQVDAERAISARASAQIELLNQQIAAMRRQLAALEDALNASESRDRESQTRIADLGSRLNVALAQRVQELTRYRSDFFGRLRQIVGSREGIRIVGDRFVLQSEVLFDAGQAVLSQFGKPELDRIGSAILDLEKEIPPRHRLGHARRRAHGQTADPVRGVPVELGALLRARHRGGAVPGEQGRFADASPGGGLRRVPAPRHGRQRRRLPAQPAHRAEAHRTLGKAIDTRRPGAASSRVRRAS